jgi:mono/diheme cytochrome c family protein
LWIVFGIVLMAGCSQEMANQPRYEPLEPSAFFQDGRSSRHLVPGTVARGQQPLNTPFATGRANGDAVDTLPLPLTEELLGRGEERYNIYCAPCHNRVGTGQGMIVRRGYPRPPSFHNPRLRQVPIGHFFVVITGGFGRMPAYGWMVPPHDRWAIAAYIRALQYSQYAPVADLPAETRQQFGK